MVIFSNLKLHHCYCCFTNFDYFSFFRKISFAKFESQNQIFLSIAFEVTMPHIGDRFLRSVISLDKQTDASNPIVFGIFLSPYPPFVF